MRDPKKEQMLPLREHQQIVLALQERHQRNKIASGSALFFAGFAMCLLLVLAGWASRSQGQKKVQEKKKTYEFYVLPDRPSYDPPTDLK